MSAIDLARSTSHTDMRAARRIRARIVRAILTAIPIVFLAGAAALASFSVEALRSPASVDAACNGWPSSGGVPQSGHDFFDFSSGSGTWSDGDLKVRLPSTYTCSAWIRTYTYNGMSTATGAHWYWKRMMTSAGGTTNCNYAGSGVTDYMMGDGCGDGSFSVISGTGVAQNTTYTNFGVGYASCSTDYGANVGWTSNATPGANCGTPATRIPDGSPPKFDWTNPTAPTVTVTPGANSFLSGTTLFVNGTTAGSFTSAASGSTDTGGSGLSNYTQTLTGTTTGWSPTSSSAASQSFTWTTALVDAQSTTLTVRATDVATNTSTGVVRTLISDETAPAFTSFSAPTAATTYQSATGFTFTWNAATDTGGSGVASYQRVLQSAPIASPATCSTTWTNVTDHGLSSATSQAEATGTMPAGQCWRLAVAPRDQVTNIAAWSYSNPILVDATAPTGLTVTNDTASRTCSSATSPTSTTVYFRPACPSSFTLTASATDNESGIASYSFGALTAPTGWTVTGSGASRTYAFTGTSAATSLTVTAVNNAGLTSAGVTLNFVVDSTAPATSFSAPAAGGPVSATSPYTVTFAATDAGSGFGKSGSGWSLQRQVATYTGTCGTFANDAASGNLVAGITSGASLTSNQTLASGNCYRWVLNAADNVGNAAAAVTSGSIQLGPIPTVVVTDNTGTLPNAYRSGNTIYVRTTGSGSVQLTATGSDPGSTITSNTFGALSGTPTGWSPTAVQTGATNPYSVTYGWSSGSPSTSTSVTSRNALGIDSSPVVITFTPDGTAPAASFSAPGAGQAGQSTTAFTVTFAASDGGSGFGKSGAGWSLQRQIATASGNVCGTFANDTAAGNLVTGTTSGSGQTSGQTLVAGNCYQWVLTVTDSVGLTASATSGRILVDTTAPAAPSVADNGPAGSYRTGDTIFFRPSAGSTLTLTSTGVDAVSGIASSTFGALSAATGWTYTPGTVSGNPTAKSLTWSSTAVSATLPVTTTNNVGAVSPATTITLTADATAPTISSLLPAAGTSSQSTTSVTVSWSETETGSGVGVRALQRQKASATSSSQCATATYANDGSAADVTSPATQSGLAGNTCYRWTLVVTDRVGNASTLATTGNVFIAVSPTLKVLVDPTTNKGATNYVTVAIEDGFGNPKADYTGTITISASDPLAVFPDGTTFFASAPGYNYFQGTGTGHNFKVLLGTIGPVTITATASGLQNGTASVTVGNAALTSSAPQVVWQNTPFAMNVKPVVGDQRLTTYGAKVTLSSSDTTAQFLDADANKQYTFACDCQDGHDFIVSLGTLGTQTVTTTDPFGLTTTVTVDVQAPPAGGSSPIAAASVVQWSGGNTLDWYLKAAPGRSYTVLYANSHCGVFGQPPSENHAVNYATSKTYDQFSTRINQTTCYFLNFYGVDSHSLLVLDEQRRAWTVTPNRYLYFSDVPENANYSMLNPGDPFTAISIFRGPGDGIGHYHYQEDYTVVTNGTEMTVTTNQPVTIWSIEYMPGAQGSYSVPPERQWQQLPKATNYLAKFDDYPWHNSCLQQSATTDGRMNYFGADGRMGQRYGPGLWQVQSTYHPSNWGCSGSGFGGNTHRPNSDISMRNTPLSMDFSQAFQQAWDNVQRAIERDPVDTFSGSYLDDVTDFSLGGLTPSLSLQRRYVTLAAERVAQGLDTNWTLFGPGWSSNLDWRVVNNGEDGVTVSGAGGIVTFQTDGTGYAASNGEGASLVQTGSGWDYKDTAGAIHRFDQNGRLAAILDPVGHQLSLTWDGTGKLASYTDASGRVATVTTNASGKITRVDLQDGRYVTFGYNAAGFLTSARRMDGTSLTYVPDTRGRLTAVKDAADHVLIANVYDGDGRVIAQTDALGHTSYLAWDQRTKAAVTVDTLGAVSVDCYNARGHILVRVDTYGGIRRWTYDGNAHVSSVTDELGKVTSTTYDSKNQLTKIVDPLGHVSTLTYDGFGHPATITTGGLTSTITFDPTTHQPLTVSSSNGTNSLTTATYGYNATSKLLTTATAQGGAVTTYHYDSRGYVDWSLDPEGRKTSYVTDARGFITSVVDPLGYVTGETTTDHTTTYTYDDMGRILTMTDPLGNAAGGNAAAHRTTYTYDEFGRVKTVSRASGALTTYNYDLAGRLTSTVVKLTASVNATTTYEYDWEGRLTAVTDPENRRTETAYDLLGRPTQVTDPDGKVSTTDYDAKGRVTDVVDATGVHSATAYDALDRVITVTDGAGKDTTFTYDPVTGLLRTVIDPLTHATQYDYDWLGRRTSVTNAENDTSSVTYDAQGNIDSATNARNKTTRFTYNLAHQLETVTEPGDAGDIVTTYTYDDAGRLQVRENDRGGTDTYAYDSLNRPTRLTDANSKVWQTFYTNDGQIDHTIDGKGQTTSFGYDLAGRLTTVTPTSPTPAIGYTYDKSGLIATETDTNGTTQYGRDPVGRLSSVTRNARTTGYGYDDAGRLETVTYPAGLGSVSYGYDTAGRLSTITDWASRVSTYHYDDASRIQSLDRPGGLVTTYTYDDVNRPLSATTTRSATTVLAQAWTYDPDGNIATATDDTGTAVFTYDNLDRLLTASYPGTQNYSYTYDAVGNILTATTPTGVATYTYDLGDRITSTGPGAPGDTTPPTAPTGLTATAVSSGRVNLSWTAATDAVGVTRYTIRRDGTAIAIVNGTATSFVDWSVAASTSYTYTVLASDAAGNSGPASSGAPTTTPGSDASAPTTPTGVTATAAAWNRVNVSWTASSDNVGVTRYTINRGGTPIAVVPGTATSFSDFSVAGSTAYAYTVVAADASGNASGASSAGSATTPADPGNPANTSNAPTTNDNGWTSSASAYASDDAYATASPSKNGTSTFNVGTFGFNAVIPANATITSATVTVEWKVDTTASVATLGSQLFSGATAKGSEFVNSAEPTSDTSETYVVTGLTRNDLLDGTLTIRVRASRGNSNTAFTASVDTVTVRVDYTTPTAADSSAPTTPTGLAATVNGANRIDLTWTASTDDRGVQGYVVKRDGTQVGTLPVGATSFFDTGVSAGLHAYTVTATDGAGNTSAASTSASATATNPTSDSTAPSVPTGVAAAANGSKRIDVSWTASTDNVGVQGYRVFRDGSQVLTVPVGTVTFADTGIAAGLHSYTVAAVDGSGNASAPSTSASATAAPQVGGASAPVYDDNGNMTSDGSYGNRTYGYDTLGRLTTVTASDGSVTTYQLDGFGNRWAQSTGAATTTFDLDLSPVNPTILYDGARKYLAGSPGLGYESSGTWRTALTDLIGSPIEYVDTAGTVSGLTHYDPYGAPRQGSTASVGIGYAGEYRDTTGLVNLRARSYDPVLGRFIGRDTFSGVASAPQTGNRYAYAVANPLRYTDPSGHFVNAVLAVAPTLAEMAITFNPVGAVIVFGYQMITGTDLATGEAVNRDLATGGLVLTLLPPAAKFLFKSIVGLGRDAAIGMEGAGTIGARATEEAAAAASAEREIAAAIGSARPAAGAERVAAIKNALSDSSGTLLRSSAERAGVKFTIRRVESLGYELGGAIKYSGNQGIDLWFKGVGQNAGRYALAEAKAGAGLGKLVVDASGYRQGSLRFFESRLARAVGEGVPEATELRTALANSRVDLFGGFKASNKLYQFDPNVFIDYVNFKLVPGAAILVP